MKNNSRAAMDWFLMIGELLVLICVVHALISMFINLATNRGVIMLADIISIAAGIVLFFLVKMYFKQEEMYELPAVAIIVFMATNLFRIGTSWSYLLYLVPIALMVLTILKRWNVLGMSAGAAMFLVNIIVTIVVFYSQTTQVYFSSYFCGHILGNNSLMGIACVLFYLVVKEKTGQMLQGRKNEPSDGISDESGGMSW